MQFLQVQDNLAACVAATGRRSLLVGEKLRNRDAVELGEFGKPGNRDSAVAALVRTDDDRLPLAAGLALDTVERKSLLGTNRPQPTTQGTGVLTIVGRLSRCFVGLGMVAEHRSVLLRHVPCPSVIPATFGNDRRPI